MENEMTNNDDLEDLVKQVLHRATDAILSEARSMTSTATASAQDSKGLTLDDVERAVKKIDEIRPKNLVDIVVLTTLGARNFGLGTGFLKKRYKGKQYVVMAKNVYMRAIYPNLLLNKEVSKSGYFLVGSTMPVVEDDELAEKIMLAPPEDDDYDK